MKYYSIQNPNLAVSFRQAVLQGIAPDGGLYMPERYPVFSKEDMAAMRGLSFAELAFRIAKPFIDDIPDPKLEAICQKVFTFDTPLAPLDERLSVLELFHGPTLAFKDFGARFLAALLERYRADADKETFVLVATSGDTGSAVAQGFLGMEHIKVALLYPSGKVSRIQEQQLTTIGGNIFAFEVQGTFDSCQALVKRAFRDDDLKKVFNLSPANSINIARLLPQSFYYFRALAQIPPAQRDKLYFVVPSGNFGNLTAGLMAAQMGLPVRKFVAAVNANRFFPDYLQKGKAEPRPALPTYSNAMDVGNPSNFVRIVDLFGNDFKRLRSGIISVSVDDEQTLQAIAEIRRNYNYTIDPHGAVGYKAWKNFRNQLSGGTTILLETAHPGKFRDVVEKAVSKKIPLPERLAECLNKPKNAVLIGDNYDEFRERLLSL